MKSSEALILAFMHAILTIAWRRLKNSGLQRGFIVDSFLTGTLEVASIEQLIRAADWYREVTG